MKYYRRVALICVALFTICVASGYHHYYRLHSKSETPQQSIGNNTRKKLPAEISPPLPAQSAGTNAISDDNQPGRQFLIEFVDQIISDAIQRGALDPNRLTAKQLALLPEKFRKHSDNNVPQLSADEIAHIEQQIALGDDAPPEPPPPFPCPDPNHLPENYNNDYNKMILRERGCKI